MRIIFIIVLFTHFSFAQVATLELQYYNPCTGQVEPDSSYYQLISSDSTVVLQSPNSNTIKLDKLGNYIIQGFLETTEILKVNIQPGKNLLIYRKDSVVEALKHMHGPMIYLCCEQPCNGKVTDYYMNGNLKWTGTFSNGTPTDTVTHFWPNGNRKFMKVIHSKTETNFYYDENGQLEMKDVWGKKAQLYRYYSNGQISSFTNYSNKYQIIREFSPDGKIIALQNKHTRKDFYEDGRLKKSIVRRRTNRFFNFCWKKLLFQWNKCPSIKDYKNIIRQYDLEGNLVSELITEDWNSSASAFPSDLNDSDWILKWISVDSLGNRTLIVESMKVDDYLNENPEPNNR